jgi:polyphosphate kinase
MDIKTADKDILFINREISWLHFNERVLQEAIDKATPLIERMKFLGIYSNNRDEFFRVRVATMTRMLKLEKKAPVPRTKYADILREINRIVAQQEKKFNKAYQDLVVELGEKNIFLINESDLTAEQGNFVYNFYFEKVRPFLFPLILNNIKTLSNIQDATIYLAIYLGDSNNPEHEDFAMVRIPTEETGRFLILPNENDKHYIMLMDDVIRYCLHDIFSVFGYDSFDAYTIKFTRDSELDIDNDVSKSFLEIMSESIKQRKRGEPVRFVYDNSIPDVLLKKVTKLFGITKNDTLRGGGRYHNFRDFMGFPRIGPPDFVYPPAPPLRHPDLLENVNMFDVIKEKDIMLHYPYQSFQHIVDFIREASIDPQVRSIKMTFYRAAKYSTAMNALINAARNGKYVTVFMEIQARFDEEANIYWTQRLQEEGVKIIQTIPGYKVHSKLLLVRRREDDDENVFYANVSTGNFNESTAKVYADDSLLTANPDICLDVYNLFELLESRFILPTFNTLKVAPFGIREFFIDMLEKEIENVRNGKPGWAILKMNSLVDKKITRKLYEASQAGVKIDLIVRGICVLKPGVKGLSENINAFSIVDKYLEHSRVYIFGNDGEPKYFIASADFMQRNFDHRIEVVCPILNEEIQQELMDMMQIQMKDNTKSRYLGPDNLNTYRSNEGTGKHRAQFEIYDYFKEKLERSSRNS